MIGFIKQVFYVSRFTQGMSSVDSLACVRIQLILFLAAIFTRTVGGLTRWSACA